MSETETHEPTERRELGYSRNVCSADGIDWPCPTWAQAREAATEAEAASAA